MLSDSRIVKRFACAVVLATGAAGAIGQAGTPNATANSELPSFEVVSIKPTTGGIAGFRTYPGGRTQCSYCTVWMIIHFAFDLEPFQIVGAPAWMERTGFNITAVPPASSEASKLNPPFPYAPLSTEQKLMLQSLLIERFQFKYHLETKPGAIYVLKKGAGALKLTPPKDPSAPFSLWIHENGLEGRNIEMQQFAERLSSMLQRPVRDETGLKGSFDFKFGGSDEAAHQDYQDFVSGVITSVQGIGLKLKSAKGPVETIVIDHVEQPSPN